MRRDTPRAGSESFAGELIDTRSGSSAEDAPAIDAEFSVAQIIDEDEDDVGFLAHSLLLHCKSLSVARQRQGK